MRSLCPIKMAIGQSGWTLKNRNDKKKERKYCKLMGFWTEAKRYETSKYDTMQWRTNESQRNRIVCTHTITDHLIPLQCFFLFVVVTLCLLLFARYLSFALLESTHFLSFVHCFRFDVLRHHNSQVYHTRFTSSAIISMADSPSHKQNERRQPFFYCTAQSRKW